MTHAPLLTPKFATRLASKLTLASPKQAHFSVPNQLTASLGGDPNGPTASLGGDPNTPTPDAILTTLQQYPNVQAPPHWVWTGAFAKSTPVMFQGRLQPVARLILAAIGGSELPPTYRVIRRCEVDACVHPACQTLKPQNLDRYGFLHELPPVLMTPAMGAAQEIADLIEEFSTLEDPKLSDLLKRYGAVFSETQIQHAFAHVSRQ